MKLPICNFNFSQFVLPMLGVNFFFSIRGILLAKDLAENFPNATAMITEARKFTRDNGNKYPTWLYHAQQSFVR